MNNDGNYIVSLSQFTRWLAGIAEMEYGVEIYPGFAGGQLLLSPSTDSPDPWRSPVRSVRGVVTNEVGITRNFRQKSSFEPGTAGFENIAKIKGTHNAMKSGMLAAEVAFDQVVKKQEVGEEDEGEAADIKAYDEGLHKSWI